jgi:Tfp pilus assembly protein PilV
MRLKSTRVPLKGFTIPEVLVACLLFGTIIFVSARMTHVTAQQRRATDRHACALWEAANQMEQLTAARWDDLTEERLAERPLSAAAVEQLPEGELVIDVAEIDEPLPARQISLQVRYRGLQGERIAPVKLTAWVYKPSEQASNVKP